VIWLLLGCVPHYAARGPIAPAELRTALPMARVDVGGIGAAYVDSGGDKPVLLFVHGLSSSLSFWDPQLREFAADYRVIALDLPGFGASDRPDAPFTPPWYADFAVSFLDALGVGQVTWVGHSMGAQIGMHAALNHPDRVERLVLVAPAGFEPFTPGEAGWMKRYWTEKRTLETDEPGVRTSFTRLVFNVRDDAVERWIEERVRLADTEVFRGTSVAVSRCIAGMLDYPVRKRLGDIHQPTLIVFGTQDRLIPNPILHGGSTRAVAAWGHEHIPGSELVMIPGAGHGVQHDAPEAFGAALRSFLDD
jgi:pimeloyl-ACP methyl ester carboxylesterase